MSPNDLDDWILKERELIRVLLKEKKPIFGACFGAQQITKAIGYTVSKSPVKKWVGIKYILKQIQYQTYQKN